MFLNTSCWLLVIRHSHLCSKRRRGSVDRTSG